MKNNLRKAKTQGISCIAQLKTRNTEEHKTHSGRKISKYIQ